MTPLSAIGLQIGLVAIVLVVTFSGPAVAISLMTRRKRISRLQRLSPLGTDLLRPPGHALRERIDELRLDAVGEVMALCIFPPLLSSLHLAQSYLTNVPTTPFRVGVLAAFVLAGMAFLIHRLLRKSTELDRLKLGLDAEMAVGQELDQLMRHGAHVFHDVPADGFNIDHVVIAAQGIFAVETKGFSKQGELRGRERAHVVFDGTSLRFPDIATREPIQQADRQARWLATWLSKATALNVHVQPVLVLPGWFVDRQGAGDVEVYSGKQLPGLLSRRRHAGLDLDSIQRLSHQLEQRCRNVVPTYKT